MSFPLEDRKQCVFITHVTPIYPRGNFIQWEVKSNEMPSTPWVFNLERSESPEGPWTPVDDNPIENAYSYFDLIPLHALKRHIYYRVRLVDGTGCCFTSEAESNITALSELDIRVQGEVLRMRQDLYTLLSVDAGQPITVFKRRNYGQRCTKCRSGLLDLTLYPYCDSCLGTKFEEPVYSPIHTLALFNDPPVQEGVDVEGETELRVFQLKMLDCPLLAVDDLIFERRTGQLYEVKNPSTTRRHRMIVHQEPTVGELERSHPFYRLVNGIVENRLGAETFVFDSTTFFAR